MVVPCWPFRSAFPHIAVTLFLFFYAGGAIGENNKKTLHYFQLGEKNNNFSEINLNHESHWSTTVQIRIATLSHAKINAILKIVAPKDFGIMGFVKQAHLRVHWNKEINHGLDEYFRECKDYLQFEGVDEKMVKVCHEVDQSDHHLHPTGLVGPRTIKSTKDELEIKIYVDSSKQGKNNKNGNKILAEITFTAYSDCWNIEAWENFGRCSKSNSLSCIHTNLFCDGEINCIFEENFGTDEKNCSETVVSRNKLFTGKGISTPGSKEDNKEIVPESKSEYEQMKQYFVPTAFIFFIIWGLITLIRKCYKCYRTDYAKEEIYY